MAGTGEDGVRVLSCLWDLASLSPPSSFPVTHSYLAVPILQRTLFGTLLYAPPDLLSPRAHGQSLNGQSSS